MPASWDLPRSSNLWDQQDVNRYNKLPVWMAEQQVKQLPFWGRWQNLLGTIKWEANMGDVLQGVIAETPPVNKQKHLPRNITETPLKTVVSHFERSNTARVKRHLFESPLFHFLPSFRDFRKKQVSFAARGLNKIVGVGSDNFLRWQVLQQSKRVFVVQSTDGSLIQNAPAGEATDTTEPKDSNWFAAISTKVGNNTGYLDFRTICAVREYARKDLGMVPWDGVPANPGENATMDGKWVLVGESALYDGLAFDEHILNFKDYAMNLLNSKFRGVIQGNINFQEERYPLLFSVDASGTVTFPEPEIEEALGDTYPNGNTNGYEVIPNPDYVNATYGIAFFMGYQPYESIKVGPPPSEFSSGSIKMGKFHSLNWNGEVRITDDVLVNYGSGNLDTNKYGEYLQLICDTVLGVIPNTPRHCLPVIYRRVKAPSLLPIS